MALIDEGTKKRWGQLSGLLDEDCNPKYRSKYLITEAISEKGIIEIFNTLMKGQGKTPELLAKDLYSVMRTTQADYKEATSLINKAEDTDNDQMKVDLFNRLMDKQGSIWSKLGRTSVSWGGLKSLKNLFKGANTKGLKQGVVGADPAETFEHLKSTLDPKKKVQIVDDLLKYIENPQNEKLGYVEDLKNKPSAETDAAPKGADATKGTETAAPDTGKTEAPAAPTSTSTGAGAAKPTAKTAEPSKPKETPKTGGAEKPKSVPDSLEAKVLEKLGGEGTYMQSMINKIKKEEGWE